jgi:hypothetical protein
VYVGIPPKLLFYLGDGVKRRLVGNLISNFPKKGVVFTCEISDIQGWLNSSVEIGDFPDITYSFSIDPPVEGSIPGWLGLHFNFQSLVMQIITRDFYFGLNMV